MIIICYGRRPMTDPAAPQAVRRSTNVELCPVVQTNVHWPVPVDQRLNELLGRLTDLGGGETSRSQLLSALVAAAPADGDELENLLRRYRTLTAGAVVLQSRGPIVIPIRRPGRRPRAS
jgi:hypothetical protein